MKKFIYMLTLLPKVSKKIIETFLIEFFPFATSVNNTGGCGAPVSCEYLSEFSKKLENPQMGYSGAWGKLIHENPEVDNLVSRSL
jgi:hypothetical protein